MVTTIEMSLMLYSQMVEKDGAMSSGCNAMPEYVTPSESPLVSSANQLKDTRSHWFSSLPFQSHFLCSLHAIPHTRANYPLVSNSYMLGVVGSASFNPRGLS